MSTQLLIYEKAAPLSKQTHGDWSVEVENFSFARDLNSVPLMAAEFLVAAKEYAIGFSKVGENIQPIVLLGMRAKENLFLSEDNEWAAKYVPAFLRRYPFVFASSEDGKTFTLCVDETFEGFNQEGKGEPLYDDKGEPSPYVQRVLQFLQNFQNENARTQLFCQRLAERDLLESYNATWTAASGEKTVITGLHFVNRKKLQALDGEALKEMIASGEMDLIFAHLNSLSNFQEIKVKMNATAPVETAPPKKKSKNKK